MKDTEKKVALLAVTNEILDGKFVLFTGVKKFQEKVGIWMSKIKNIPAPGEYIEYGAFSRKIFWPLNEHLISNIDFTSGCSSQIYKLYFWNNEYFSDEPDYIVEVKQELVGAIVNRAILPAKEDIYDFIILMFMGKWSVRGETRGKLINVNTPCGHFFHTDVDGISLGIGSPIEKRFGLETLSFKWGTTLS